MRAALIVLLLAVTASALIHPSLRFKASESNKMFCGICKDLVKDIENMGEQEALAFLKKEIKKLCGDVPFVSELCESTLDDVAEELVRYAEQHMSPQDVCKKVHLC